MSKHKERYGASRRAPYEPDDGAVGLWPRERLEAMNERFVAAMERAIRLGLERPHGEAQERAA